MSKINKSALSLFSLLFLAQIILAQPKDNSPYSRMGIGDLSSLPYTANLGSGGFTAGFNDPFQINAMNPAALGYLRATSYEFGFNMAYKNLQQDERSQNVWSGNLKTLALAFPVFNPVNTSMDRVKRKLEWGMHFGLSPYSTVGYDIRTIDDLDQVGSVFNSFQGTGGTYRLNWSNGFKIDNIAFGISVNRFIGNINSNRTISIPSQSISYVNTYLDDYSVRSWQYAAGLQYTLNFGDKETDAGKEVVGNSLVIGAYGNLGSDMRFRASQLYTSTNDVYAPFGIDTLVNTTNIDLESTLPASFTAGFVYKNGTKFKFGFDFTQTFWSEFVNPLRSEFLSDATRINTGIEFVPDANSYNSYSKRIRYRAGFIYENDYRVIGTNLKNIGITLGVGLPIRLPRQQVSAVNLSLELGSFGVEDYITENYAKLNVGFTLNDNLWFFKRKFF